MDTASESGQDTGRKATATRRLTSRPPTLILLPILSFLCFLHYWVEVTALRHLVDWLQTSPPSHGNILLLYVNRSSFDKRQAFTVFESMMLFLLIGLANRRSSATSAIVWTVNLVGLVAYMFLPQWREWSAGREPFLVEAISCLFAALTCAMICTFPIMNGIDSPVQMMC